MSEKITRKDMKAPDEFIKKSSVVMEFFLQHRKQIIIVTIGLLVAVAFYFLYDEYQDSKENSASYDYGLIESELQANKDQLNSTIEAKFNDLLKKHSGTFTALNVKVKLADLYFKNQKYNEAFDLYKDIYEGKRLPLLKNVSLTNMAYIKEISSDYKTALGYFDELSKSETEVFSVQGLFGMSRCYEKMNETEKAKELYNKIIQKYPNSENAKLARRYLLLLEEG